MGQYAPSWYAPDGSVVEKSQRFRPNQRTLSRPAPKQAQEAEESPQPAPEKKGFFSRLFGKK